MDTLRPPIVPPHAAMQNTPLKLRTTSVPTSGKIFKVEDVNHDLLVELDDATIDEGTLNTPSHFVLNQSNQMLPRVAQSIPSAGNSQLQIMSLALGNEKLYRNGFWDPMEVPNMLRSQPTTALNANTSTSSLRVRQSHLHSSQQRHTNTGPRHVTVQRSILGTSQEETIKGTFVPTAGSKEECIAKWLNRITDALLGLIPKNAVPSPTIPATTATNKIITCSATCRPQCYWSSETSCKPIKDSLMPWKPDVVLREKDSPIVFGPQPEFSWKDVMSFVELSSTPYSNSEDVKTVRNNVMCKVYAVFASQPGRRFLFALSIANKQLRVHMFDRSGVVHSHCRACSTAERTATNIVQAPIAHAHRAPRAPRSSCLCSPLLALAPTAPCSRCLLLRCLLLRCLLLRCLLLTHAACSLCSCSLLPAPAPAPAPCSSLLLALLALALMLPSLTAPF